MSEDCEAVKTFLCRFATFQFEFMPFVLIKAPLTFHRMMDKVFSDLSYVQVYLDSIVVALDTIQ